MKNLWKWFWNLGGNNPMFDTHYFGDLPEKEFPPSIEECSRRLREKEREGWL